MPDETIQQLKKHLEALVGQDPSFQAFLDAVKDAEEEISRLHGQDAYGRVPQMTREDRNGLLRLLREIGTKAEGVLRNEDDKTRKDLVKKITALAAGNHRALLHYDPETEPETLPSVLSEVRVLTLDARGTALKSSVSNSANARQPVTFLDDKGREITGVFTPETVVNVRESLRRTIERLSAEIRDPIGKQIFGAFPDKVAAWGAKQQKGDLRYRPENRKLALLGPFLQRVGTGDSLQQLDFDGMRRAMNEIFAEELRGRDICSAIPKKLLRELGQAVCDQSVNVNVNMGSGRIPDGARLDTRNAAMSAMADLLGVPNLLARSRPMTMILPDGRTVNGTFMTEAHGLDPKNLSEQAAGIDKNAVTARTPDERMAIGKGFKDLADLQILDYLCGRTGRRSGNILYQFTDGNRFCGAQGIENDCSFGLTAPGADPTGKELPALDQMGVISESMYKAVSELTPETMRFCLRGFGLSERELDAAAFRLNALQAKLESDRKLRQSFRGSDLPKGCIRIIENQDWPKLRLTELCAGEAAPNTAGNLFAQARSAIDRMSQDYAEQKHEVQSLRSELAVGTGNRAIPSEQAREAGKARRLAVLLMKRTTQGRSSPQYDAMQKVVEEYAFFQHEIQKRIEAARRDLNDPDAPCESIVSRDDIQKMRELSQNVRDKAFAYLEHKGNGLHHGYSARRVEAAKLALELGRQGAKLRTEESDTAERNEKAALETVNRRVDNKPEGFGRGKGKESPFEKTDFDAATNDAVKNDPPQLRKI